MICSQDGCTNSLDDEPHNRVICYECQLKVAIHPQVLTPYGFHVDENICELVVALNDHGYRTTNSCQENGYSRGIGHYIWIEMLSDDAKRLFEQMDKDSLSDFKFKESIDRDCISIRFPQKDLEQVTNMIFEHL